jgi:hypothetical protein
MDWHVFGASDADGNNDVGGLESGSPTDVSDGGNDAGMPSRPTDRTEVCPTRR